MRIGIIKIKKWENPRFWNVWFAWIFSVSLCQERSFKIYIISLTLKHDLYEINLAFVFFFLQNSYETRQEWSFTYHRDLSFTNFTCIAVGYRNQTVSKTMQFGDIYCKCPIIDSEHYSNFCALIS